MSSTTGSTRKTRTIEEREAALEAELVALRAKNRARKQDELDALLDQREIASKKIATLMTKRGVLDSQINELRAYLKLDSSDE